MTWKEDYVNIYETFTNPDGSTYQPPRFWKLHDRFKEFIHSGKNHKQCPMDMSLQELIRTKFLPKNPSKEDLYFAQYIMNFTYGLPNGADTWKLSAKYTNDYYKFSGEERFIKGGYA